jgi:hypothetical protein
LGIFPGSLDELAVDKGQADASHGDEMGCIDGTPAVLR